MSEEKSGAMSREDMERLGVIPAPRKRDRYLFFIGSGALVVGVFTFFWALVFLLGIHIHWQGLLGPALLLGGLCLAFFGLITLFLWVFKKSSDAARRN